MAELRVYDQLLKLPLFLGLSRDDLSKVISHTPFGFLKYHKGKMVIMENEPCDRLYFLLKGTLNAESSADDHSYRFIEELSAPEVLQPERLFGLHQRFTKNFICKTEVSLMTLEKVEVMRLSQEFSIFRLNLLNIISAQTQKLSRHPWRRTPQDIGHRIARFLESHCDRPAGPKTVYIRMIDLAKELNESRLDISRALNLLSHYGLATLSRGKIIIPALEKLLMDNNLENITVHKRAETEKKNNVNSLYRKQFTKG
jgi:CRP-like cAMP-binding protein